MSQCPAIAFRLGAAASARDCFLGTDVFVPPGARIGDNCLLGTKVMAPIDGPVRENVGLLGSPSFEIPRAASRDGSSSAGSAPRSAAAAYGKRPHNLAPRLMMLAMHGFVEFLAVYILTLAGELFGWRKMPAMSTALGFSPCYVACATQILVERASIGFRRLRPLIATSYDRAFWRGRASLEALRRRTRRVAIRRHPDRPGCCGLCGRQGRTQGVTTTAAYSERTLVEIGDGADPQPGRHGAIAFVGRRRLQVGHHPHRRRRRRWGASAHSSTTA